MRETDLWARLSRHLGSAYAQVWADQTNLAGLGNRTVREALDAGVPCKAIWRVVWEALELPAVER
ncbi:MAG TPA: DUF3046 domain-containing protein [Propionibacterium sp.]|nr:DUF3046 domain-containing protein [Propionibacterium sp.]